MNYVSNPLPLWLLGLWFAVLPGWRVASWLSRRTSANREVRRLIEPGLFVTVWMLAVLYCGLIQGGFVEGLTIGSVAIGILGCLAAWHDRGAAAETSDKGELAVIESSKAKWIGAGLTGSVILLIGLRLYFADELHLNGHLSLPAQMQNGVLPPRILAFPDLQLRYHYGFDLLCAMTTALTRLPIPITIDILTTLGWIYSWLLLWTLGNRLFWFPHAGTWVATVTLLSGGMSPFVRAAVTPLTATLANEPWFFKLHGGFTVGANMAVNYPLAANFFQHPFALGIPLALCILLILSELDSPSLTSRFVSLSILCLALYFAQSILFATFLPTMVLFEGIIRKRFYFLVAAILVLLAAKLSFTGLIFAPLPEGTSRGLHFRFWPAQVSIIRITAYHVASLGMLLPLGIFGLFLLRRLQLVFAIIAIGCVLVPFFIGYRFTWDMVKFTTVASLMLGILSGGAVAFLATGKSRRSRVIFVTSVLFLFCSASLAFVGIKLFGPGDPPIDLTSDECQALNWLRTHAAAEERIACPPERALRFAIWGGVQVVYPLEEYYFAPFGVPPSRRHDLEVILRFDQTNSDFYLKRGVHWIAATEEDKELWDLASLLTGKGQAVEDFRSGSLSVFRLLEPSPKFTYRFHPQLLVEYRR